MNKDERGFTLIELLAVITITGVLVMIAIPSITIILQNVRKSIYVSDAKVFKNETQKEVINQTWAIDDKNTTYYIHINNVSEDREPSPSPWAKWKDAYVGITIDEKGGFNYYWLSVDNAGWKSDLVAIDDISRGDIFNTNIKKVNFREAIGETSKIAVLDANGVWRYYQPYLELTRDEASKCYSYYDKSDTTIKIAFYNEKCGKDVIIPAKIGGKTVDEIHSYAFNDKKLESIFIPDTIKIIGTRAFAYNNLTQLYIPSSVTTIESEAFMKNKLTNLTLDEGLNKMGARCFQNNSLTVASVPDSVTSLGACSYCENPIPNPSFLYEKKGDEIDYSRVRGYIGDLTEFTENRFIIPSETNGVELKEISAGAFESMALSDWNVVIPNTVEKIGNSAFSFSGIGSVNLPDALKIIGSSAFYSCHLTDINIPSGVQSIGELAFIRNNISDPNKAWIYRRTSEGIDYSTLLMYCGAKKNNVEIPKEKNGVKLKTIASSAFRYVGLSGTLTIPDSVTSIGQYVFPLNSLSDINNGTGDDEIGPFLYARKSGGGYDKTNLIGYGAQNTKNVIIPKGVKKIGDYAFYYTRIGGVTIPEGVTSIGGSVFNLCNLSGTVVIPSTVESIGSGAFKKEVTWAGNNADLVKFVNKTGKQFDWKSITGGPTAATFETGTIENWYGNIEVTKN